MYLKEACNESFDLQFLSHESSERLIEGFPTKKYDVYYE